MEKSFTAQLGAREPGHAALGSPLPGPLSCDGMRCVHLGKSLREPTPLTPHMGLGDGDPTERWGSNPKTDLPEATSSAELLLGAQVCPATQAPRGQTWHS